MLKFNDVPIASTSRRSIATASRRRRIIYETARRLSKEYQRQGIIKTILVLSSILKIQSFIRKSLYRCRLETFLSCRSYASIQIQSIFRGSKVRQNLRLRIKSLSTVTCIIVYAQNVRKRMERINMGMLVKASAAIVVQNSFRAVIAREKLQEMQLRKLHTECAAIVIQSFARKFAFISSRYREINGPKATSIQRYFRGHQARTHRNRILSCVLVLQTWLRGIFLKVTIDGQAIKGCIGQDHCSESAPSPQHEEESSHCLSDSSELDNPNQPHHHVQNSRQVVGTKYFELVSFSPIKVHAYEEPTFEEKHIFSNYEKNLDVTTILTSLFNRQKSAILIQRYFRQYRVDLIQIRMVILQHQVKKFTGAIFDATINRIVRRKKVLIATTTIQSHLRSFLTHAEVRKKYVLVYKRVIDLHRVAFRFTQIPCCANDDRIKCESKIVLRNRKENHNNFFTTKWNFNFLPKSSLPILYCTRDST